MPDESIQPKYLKPKILLIDMSEGCEQVLRTAGYNVSVGSFGMPYEVTPSDSLQSVKFDTCRLPNYQEQEVVILNTECPAPDADPPENIPGMGVLAYWQSAADGEIDPRPLRMATQLEASERILNHGGIFIVLLSQRYSVRYQLGCQEFGRFRRESESVSSNWSFLNALDSFSTDRRSGVEIEFDPKRGVLSSLLKQAATNARYECVLAPPSWHRDKWIPLAKNKFGEDVAGILCFKEPVGVILLLPQMPSIHTILVRLLEENCTQWRPHLFPEHEGMRWVHREEYELCEINELRRQIDEVKESAEQRVKQLEDQILRVREENEDWYTLLNGTGDKLVKAVISGLKKLGFEQVVDMDEQARQAGETEMFREDIQIRDKLPILIVDVKGVAGHPEDAEATQSEKHALMRSEEFNGNMKPLTIINHQRNLPPHDRDQRAYRPEIIENAEKTGLGLMTTWDLFRLLRNKEALGWPPEVVKPVFYRRGRIAPVPDHYSEIGAIVHVWENAFGVIPTKAVTRKSTLAIEVGDRFEEIVAKSIQVADTTVDEAPVESDCGIGCENAARRFREGMRVFLVSG